MMMRARTMRDSDFFDNESPVQSDDGERGEALRGLLEVIGKGRTPSARTLRLEVLSAMLKTGNGAQSLAEVAQRAGCTLRRAQQVDSEMRNFVFSTR